MAHPGLAFGGIVPDVFSHIDPLYVISGILVGGLVGFTGVGGGSLMTPILILLFRIHPSTAVGTDLLYAAATKTAGTAVHGWNKTIDWKVVGWLALGSVPMTVLTVLAIYYLGVDSKIVQGTITKTLGVALLLTAFSLFLRKPLMRWYDKNVGEPDSRHVARLTVLTGAILGVLVTLSSVGAGAIGVTALVMIYPKMPAQRIVGSDIAHAVPLTLLAGLGHSILGTINWHILVSLLCGSLPAIVVASIASARTSDTVVRVALGIVLLMVVIRFWFL
ncbi:MAG: sulfite exporter TauE/SafE family protein [Alphaproteobacteria bacterium]|nr:sulfite exporter TauE/SafE family protein [Alphaproteobacteria bacterium]MBV9692197.1 sulfite exporter TauE/SafE family protein [Alphaproteobacteria bacterium]